jgi:AcrR family transcriptional regulator
VAAQPASREDADVPPPRPRLRRGSLTTEIIVSESLRLLDEDGLDGFSLPKLGRALGADQTAVYRHFASKDDLVLAIADRLIDEALTQLEPRACWIDTLTEMARRLRTTYLAHPAAASMSAYRTTQGPAEIRAVDIIIGAILQAGFEAAEAAVMYRAVGDFALAWAGCEASFLALDKRLQQNDRAAWTQAYLSVDREHHPSIWQVRTELPEVKDDDIFESILKTVMTGLRQLAPRPCTCHAPAQRSPANLAE